MLQMIRGQILREAQASAVSRPHTSARVSREYERDRQLDKTQIRPLMRAARPADATPAGTICHAAFSSIAAQHGFPPDFPSTDVAIALMEQLMGRHDIHAVVAELDGRVVGSNFLLENGNVAGIGPITVDPAVQNDGIGRLLMQAVIERACEQGVESVRLVQATYHNRTLALYTQLGFHVREPLAVLQGPAVSARVEGRLVRAATVDDIKFADDACQRIHGHTRSRELRLGIKQGTAAVVERGGQISGYTTGLGFFGHAVGETTEDVQALIGAAQAFAGPGLLVPARNAALMRWCLEHGLRIVQPMTLMTLGSYAQPRGAFLPSVLY